MQISTELLTFGLAVSTSALSVAYYMNYKGQNKGQLVQGVVAVFGGLITFMSLFFPWIYVEGFEVSGFDLGMFFVYLTNNQLVRAMTFFIIFLALMIILGGFLQIIGYELAKRIINTSSSLNIFLTVIIVLWLSFIPVSDLSLILEITPWICLTGATMAWISTKLHR